MSDDRIEPPGAVLLSRRGFSVDRATGEGQCSYVAKAQFTNRHGTVQGGFLAAMLDSATGLTLISCLDADETAVTRTLTVDFLGPAKPGPIDARTRIVSRDGTAAEVIGELIDANGVTVARGKAHLRILSSKSPRNQSS